MVVVGRDMVEEQSGWRNSLAGETVEDGGLGCLLQRDAMEDF